MNGPLRTDVDKFLTVRHGGDRCRSAKVGHLLIDSDLHCVLTYRFGRWADATRAKHRPGGTALVVLHRILNRWVHTHHHAEISRHADIGSGFLLMHRHGIFIGPVRIGSNCVIHQNVTLGERVAGGNHDCPVVGNDVWIGPGAIVSGGITVGDRVTISAGSVLSRSVPDGCLVAGNPARVIRRDYENSDLLSYTVTETSTSG